MFLTPLELTQALLPDIFHDEVVLMIQDNIGLYEGKYKLPNKQNGKVYLTSHRICYVDHIETKKQSIALHLKDVDRFNYSSGFLKSSPKITLYPKQSKNRSTLLPNPIASPSRASTTSPGQRPDGPHMPPVETPPVSSATWICTICGLPNPIPREFDPKTATIHTPLDTCKACGIKPTLAHVLKATISNATGHQSIASPLSSPTLPRSSQLSAPSPYAGSGNEISIGSPISAPTLVNGLVGDAGVEFSCPRCTFSNHPSMMNCEMCGAPLVLENILTDVTISGGRTESPGPTLAGPMFSEDSKEPIKVSFRGGGEKLFLERLRSAMVQRKWISGGAPPMPKQNIAAEIIAPDGTVSSNTAVTTRVRAVGVAGLEQRAGNLRKQNELAIGTAFEDLESLMASAKEIIALAENFARHPNGSSSEASLAAESVTQLGIVATKDITGGSNSESLYLSELSRNIAEYLLDDSRGILKKAGGIMSLVDLWAVFNRARGGVELVSPNDFEKAVRLWEKLRLPVRLRQFKSGVLVVQGWDRTDEATIRAIKSYLGDLHCVTPEPAVPWDWHAFGRGVTAQEVAERFGWSIGVAEEELEVAEEKGVLCREAGIEGVKYWVNYINMDKQKLKVVDVDDEIIKALREMGMV